MSTFKYRPAPKAGGGLTARCTLGARVSESTLTTAIATATGLTGAQVESVIKAFADTLLTQAEGNGWGRNLYGRFSFRPTSGGTATTPDGFQNADDVNADVSISFITEAIVAWRSRLVLESLGEVGLATPMIDKIVNAANKRENEYTADREVEVRGDDLNIEPTDPSQGLFIRKSDGTEVRCSIYLNITSGGFFARIPSGTTGPLTARVTGHLNGSLRTYTYGPTLAVSV